MGDHALATHGTNPTRSLEQGQSAQARQQGLTPAEKAAAKARARRAGRRYPNLVDNMRVAARKAAKTKTSGRKRAAKSKTGKGASKTASRRTSAVRKTAKSGRKSAR